MLDKVYLDGLDPHHWFDIRLADDEVAQQLEQIRDGLDQTRKSFDEALKPSNRNRTQAMSCSRVSEDGQVVYGGEAHPTAG